jgi:hypothetical protein
MTKIIRIAFAVCLLSMFQVSWGVGSLSWRSQSTVADSSGTSIPNASTWILRMYMSTDTMVEFSTSATPYDDDTYTGIERTWNTAGLPGYFNIILTDPDLLGLAQGNNVYSVLYNANSRAGASMYCIIDGNSPSFATTVLPNMNPSGNYNVGGSIAGDWVTIVPEPSTMALIACGAGVLVARRRKKKAGEIEQSA